RLRAFRARVLQEQGANSIRDHINGDRVKATFRDNHVGVTLAWLDKFHMHRTNRRQILLNHRISGAATLGNVAVEAADQTNISIGINEDFHVEQLTERMFRKDEDALDQNDRLRLDVLYLALAPMDGEIVNGNIDRLPLLQGENMLVH